MPALRVDILDPSGAKVGSGPLIRATNVRVVRRLSKAGTVSIDVPASDPKCANLAAKNILKVWTRRAGAQVAVAAGIIDNVAARIQNDAPPLLTVSGDDLLSELANRRVLDLDISSSGSPVAIATALSSIMAFAPAGWSIDTSTYTTSSSTVYHKFGNETVLAALVWVANAVGEQFRLKGDGSRTVEWLYKQQPTSGLRAIARGDAVKLASNTGVVLLDSLDEVTDTHATITRIYPYGSGNAKGRVTLAHATWTAPAGYTKSFDVINGINVYYIKNDAADTANRIDDIQTYTSFTEIDPTSSTHKASAADQLAVTAYEDLKRRVAAVKTYRATVTKIDAAINPGDTIRVVYRRTVDAYVAVNINADLVVMEVSTSFDASGVASAQLTLATVDLTPRQTANAVQMLGVAQNSQTGVTQVAERALQADAATTATSVTGVTLATGKTLTVNATLTLTGTDGKTLTLTGALTIGADTTINGGGTISLGGFTLTVPATGTAGLLGTAQTWSALNTFSAGLLASSFLQLKKANVAGNATIAITNIIIAITSTAAARTMTLPSAASAGSTTAPRLLIFVDESGGAATNNITIQPAVGSGELINGGASVAINTNYGWCLCYSNGTNWYAKVW